MLTQYPMQRGVEQMSRGMVAHDIVAAGQIHFSDSLVADFWLPGDHFAHMDNDACRGTAHGCDFDLPASPTSSGRGERADETRIVDLSTRFNVEAGLGKNHFHLIAEGHRLNRFSTFGNQRQYFTLYFGACIGIIFDAVFAEFL